MEELQARMEAVTRDISSLSNRLDELQWEVSENRNVNASRIEDLQCNFSELNNSVQLALNHLLPKVEALLKNRAPNVANGAGTDEASAASLFQAAARGDGEVVLRLLTRGVDIRWRNDVGDSALHVAARAGHEHIVCALIGNCKVDLPGQRGRTALHIACAAGHVAIARRLLLAGAKVDANDCDGSFALLFAVRAGHLKVVELLANHGASLDACDEEGNSSLVAAAKAEMWDIVNLLLQRGASVELYKRSETDDDNQGTSEDSMTHVGINHGEYCDVDLDSPLYLVAARKKYSFIPLILERTKEKEDMMRRVLINCNDAHLAYVFEDAIPGFSRSQKARDAMVKLACDGNVRVLRAMLDVGGDVNGMNSDFDFCLETASYYGKDEVLKMLLDRGASFNVAIDGYSDFSLHNAAEEGHVKCVNLLLAAGAPLDRKDNKGNTPFDVAKTEEIRQILSSHSSTSKV